MLLDMDLPDERAREQQKAAGKTRDTASAFQEPVRLPIEDALDLHPFAPKDIPLVVEEYLAQCRQAGLSEVRLIHGKGIGAQRAVVRRLLRTLPGIVSFADAPPQAGGWGATIVRLKTAP